MRLLHFYNDINRDTEHKMGQVEKALLSVATL